MNIVILTVADLEFALDRAKAHWKDLDPRMALPDGTLLNDKYIQALAWIQAGSDLLTRLGQGTNIVPQLIEPTCDPDTDDQQGSEEDKPFVARSKPVG